MLRAGGHGCVRTYLRRFGAELWLCSRSAFRVVRVAIEATLIFGLSLGTQRQLLGRDGGRIEVQFRR